MKPTCVYLTIDTECTEERLIRGRIRPPLGYDLMMWGRFRNQSRPLGVELLLGELRAHRMAATFFVEALCTEVFGRDGLAEVCAALLREGQDIQLHLHPNLRRPEWRASGGKPLSDNIGEYTLDEQVKLLDDGFRYLVDAGVPRQSIVAFRAGCYGADNRTWDALRQVGLVLDSSLNVSYLHRECQIRWPTPEIDLFEVSPGTWELPITNFAERTGYRHLEITAISYAEMAAALWGARRNQVEHVTIIAHPAEFFVIDSAERQLGRPNRINIGRFRRLLAFLASHQDDFAVRTVGDLGRALRSGEVTAPLERPAIPRGSPVRRALRLAVQAVKRLDNRYGPA